MLRLLLLIFSLSASAAFAAQCEKLPTSNAEPDFAQCSVITAGMLNVAVRNAPPFVYEVKDPFTKELRLEGIAIDLWEEIAQKLGVEYNYVCLGLADTLALLESDVIDIAISPLTITRQREQAFDFSHQYFNSGLVFASSPSESNFDFQKAFNTLKNAFLSTNLFYLFGIFIFLLSVQILLALKNIKSYQAMPVMKDKSRPAMVTHVVLYSMLNISGIRKDVFGFSSVTMQLFSVLILVFGISVSASLFGMVTAALTQSVSQKASYSLDNIDQYRVSTLLGSTAQRYLCDSPKKPSELSLTSTWEESLMKVVDGDKDIVLGDWVQLVYLSQRPNLRNKITVHSKSYKFEPYGWGLRNNHPLKDRINQELIGILRNPLGTEIVNRYIGDEQISMKTY